MTIDKLEIKNFRGIEDITLNLNEKSVVLFGENGTGKSTVLDAIELALLSAFDTYPAEMDFPWDLSSVRFGEEQLRSFIMIGKDFFCINLDVMLKSLPYKLTIDKSTKYRDYACKNHEFIKAWNSLSENNEESIPVLAYYQPYRHIYSNYNPKEIILTSDQDKRSVLRNAFDPNIQFGDFFTWFRQRSEMENAQKAHVDLSYEDMQLKAVISAVLKMLPGFIDLTMGFFPLRIIAKKRDFELSIEQLSDGEKSVLCMFADIARRLALANPEADNPLLGIGIVLIDEVDAHLHPSWQAKIMPALMEAFPNIQFIVTTHSPKVLSEYRGAVIGLVKDDGKIKPLLRPPLYLWDAGYILESEMDTELYNKDTLTRLQEIDKLINRKELQAAERLIREFKSETEGEIHPGLLREETLLWGAKSSENNHKEGLH